MYPLPLSAAPNIAGFREKNLPGFVKLPARGVPVLMMFMRLSFRLVIFRYGGDAGRLFRFVTVSLQCAQLC